MQQGLLQLTFLFVFAVRAAFPAGQSASPSANASQPHSQSGQYKYEELNTHEELMELRTTALTADGNWHLAHADFQKMAAAAQNPCDERVRQALASAQAALKERTTAWKVYYQGAAQKDEVDARDYAELESSLKEKLRAIQSKITQWPDELAKLKQIRENLHRGATADPSPAALSKTREDLDSLISDREKSIADAVAEVAVDQGRIDVLMQDAQKEETHRNARLSFAKDLEEGVQATQARILGLTGQLAKLKQLRVYFNEKGAAGKDSPSSINALRDSDSLISEREESIAEAWKSMEEVSESKGYAESIHSMEEDRGELVRSYSALTEMQGRYYSLVYQNRADRFSSECQPAPAQTRPPSQKP